MGYLNGTILNNLPFLSQSCPLDLHTDSFYENRREAIDSRVQLLGEASVETLHSMMENVWTSQEGKVCSLVSWERFSSLQQAQVLYLSSLSGCLNYYAFKIQFSATAIDSTFTLTLL